MRTLWVTISRVCGMPHSCVLHYMIGCNNGGGGGNFLKVKRSVRKCKRTRKQFFLMGRSFLKVYAWRRGTVKTHSFALAGPFSLCEKGPAKAKLWVFTVPRRHAYTFKKVRKGTWSAPTKEQGFPCKWAPLYTVTFDYHFGNLMALCVPHECWILEGDLYDEISEASNTKTIKLQPGKRQDRACRIELADLGLNFPLVESILSPALKTRNSR